MAINVGSVVAQFKSDITDFKKGLIEVKDEVNGFADQVQNVGRTAMKVGGIMSLALTVPLVGLGTTALKAASNYEQSGVAFETMLGSAEKAQKMLNDITAMAMKTPFQLKDVETGAKQLLAYGISSEVVLKDLSMLGDIASGVGMDKLPNLILAFGQVNAATRLTGMELRQFTEAGVPLLQTLSEQLGKPVKEIQDMVSAGEIGFKDVEKALGSLTGQGGKFFNLMEKQSKTTAGQWSNFQDNVDKLLRTFGAELLPVANKVVDFLNRMLAAFQKLSPETRKTIVIVAGIVAALGPVILIVGALINSIGLIIGVVQGAAAAFGALAAAIGIGVAPLLLIIAAVVAVGAAIYLLWKNWDSVVAAFNTGVAWIQQAFTNLQTGVGNLVAGIVTWLTGLWQSIVSIFTAIGNWFLNLYNTYVLPVLTLIMTILQAVADFFMWWWYNLIEPILLLLQAVFYRVLFEISNFIMGIFTAIFNWLRDNFFIPLQNFITTKWTEISTWLNAKLVWLQNLFTTIFNWIKDNIIVPVITAIKDFISAAWDWIGNKTQDAWNWIQNNILSPMNKAKNGVMDIADGIKNWLSNTWNGIKSFFENIAGSIFSAIVKPFEDAKRKIEEIGQKIREAADKINPFHRESPSLVDNVRAGVKAIQEAYDDLGVNFQAPSLAGAGVGVATGGTIVQISLDGANISSPELAEEYAELMGDKIIRKLARTARTI